METAPCIYIPLFMPARVHQGVMVFIFLVDIQVDAQLAPESVPALVDAVDKIPNGVSALGCYAFAICTSLN